VCLPQQTQQICFVVSLWPVEREVGGHAERRRDYLRVVGRLPPSLDMGKTFLAIKQG